MATASKRRCVRLSHELEIQHCKTLSRYKLITYFQFGSTFKITEKKEACKAFPIDCQESH